MIRAAREDDVGRVKAILHAAGLEADFAAREFVVAEDDAGRVVGCARLKPLPEGASELASVAVVRHLRGSGLGTTLVKAALQDARGPVVGLMLAPDFFSRFGFERLDSVPPSLRAKAEGTCASSGFVPMVRPGGEG